MHFAVAAVGGGTLWAVTGEPWSLPVSIASGVAIDVDYALRRVPIATKVLHGWEWVVILMAVGTLTGFPWWITAIGVGYGLHIAGDQLSHQRKWWWYILTYRTWKGYSERARLGIAHWT